MTRAELTYVADKSRLWAGPNTWGWVAGYRLTLREVLAAPAAGWG
jgi:hypothetical protein